MFAVQMLTYESVSFVSDAVYMVKYKCELYDWYNYGNSYLYLLYAIYKQILFCNAI